jgi:MbtH protein
VWLGSAVFLMLAASAAFRSSPNATVAADVVGAMLARWHYIALGAPLVLFALELRHARKLVLIVVFIALIIAAAQSLVDLRIRAIRRQSLTPISELDRSDPLRKRFGALHGVSMMLLLLQTIAAVTVVAAKPREGEKRVMSLEPPEDNTIYKIVVNHEQQYSIWPADRENALGWTDYGFSGTKEECLARIKEIWTDMRPRHDQEGGDMSGGGP